MYLKTFSKLTFSLESFLGRRNGTLAPNFNDKFLVLVLSVDTIIDLIYLEALALLIVNSSCLKLFIFFDSPFTGMIATIFKSFKLILPVLNFLFFFQKYLLHHLISLDQYSDEFHENEKHLVKDHI